MMDRRLNLVVLIVMCVMLRPPFARAQAKTSTTSITRAAADAMLDFSADGLAIPPMVVLNGHTPRTAQLLGEAYRRRDPLVWKRVQLVGELGLTGIPAA